MPPHVKPMPHLSRVRAEKPMDFEYYEFECAQHGVFWRTGGKAQRLYESMERAGWRLWLCAGNTLVLRRRLKKPKRKKPVVDIFN